MFVNGWIFSALEVAWEGPASDLFTRLASFSRLILFDKRGTGRYIAERIPTAEVVELPAKPGEVLVSSTVRDLVAGSVLRFRERRLRGAQGVPGAWRLYAVEP